MTHFAELGVLHHRVDRREERPDEAGISVQDVAAEEVLTDEGQWKAQDDRRDASRPAPHPKIAGACRGVLVELREVRLDAAVAVVQYLLLEPRDLSVEL